MKENIFQKMYLDLFNRVTDAIDALKLCQPDKALALLIRAQQESEETYMRQK